MSSDDGTIRRRTVMKGAAAAGFGAVGTGLVTGSVAGRRQGGSGLIQGSTWDAHEDDRFQVIEDAGLREYACRGNEKEWRCYNIRFEGEDHMHSLYVNPNRRFDTLEDDGYDGFHEFTENELTCKTGPRVKVSFKPVDEGKGGNGNRGGR